jgi:predicted anti-sigma-YlaC factor YlaD
MGCADLVDALEQRLRGVLAGPAQEALDAHLPTCAHCGQYLEVAARVERELVERAGLPPPAALETARAKAMAIVHDLGRLDRRLKVLTATLVVVPVFERISGGPWVGASGAERMATALLSVGFVALVITLARRLLRQQRAPLTLAANDGELLAAYRSILDEELRKVPAQRTVLGLLAAGCATAAGVALLTHHAPISALLAAQVLALGIIAPTVWRHGENLRRERAALREAAP